MAEEDPIRWWQSRRTVPLSWYLVAIISVATVPLGAFAAYLVLVQSKASQTWFERNLRSAANAVVLGIERDLATSTEVLRTFGESDAVREGDRPAIEREMTRLLARRADWIGAFLLDASGSVVLARGDERALRIAHSQELRRQVADSPAAPETPRLLRQKVGDDEVTTVTLPVTSAGTLRSTLAVTFQPEKWQALLDRQGPGVEGFVGILDGDLRWLARTARGDRNGALPSPTLLAALPAPLPAQGMQRLRATGSDAAFYVAWDTIGATGWRVAVGLPAEQFDLQQSSSIAAALLGGLLAFLIGLASALVVSRGVTSPLARLAQGSPAGGKRPTVAEIEQLTRALELAEAQRDTDRAALQAKADEFETLFHRTPVGLALAIDRECRQVAGNRALFDLLGLQPGDNLSLTAADGAAKAKFTFSTRGAPLAPHELPLQRAAQHGEDVQGVEYTVERSDRSTVQLLGYAAPLRTADGSPRGAVGAFIDVTAQSLSEQERATLLAREQQARQEAEAANRTKDEFLAMFSHELRNPLSAIASAAEVLNRLGGQQPDEVRARDVIRRQVHHLTRMMEDLLDVTRVVNGKITLSRAPLDLAATVQRCTSALNVMGRLRDHRLELDLAPVWIQADSMRVDQITTNLLTNAIKYTPAGGTITVRVAADGESALLAVSDTGVGIHPDMIDRVFDLFVQVDRASTRRQGGLGVGLTLVRRLAEIHGGSVVAHSDGAERGSRFEVRFPRVPQPPRS